MPSTPGQRYLAEFLGTFAVLFFVTGAAVFTSLSGGAGPSRIFLISASVGIAVAGGIYALGEISGGHFNPAVTLSMAMSRRMPGRDVVPYILAQVAGAIAGALVILGVAYGNATVWGDANSGVIGSAIASQGYNAFGAPYTYGIGSVFLLELALTFLFVLVIQFVTRPENGAKNLAPLAIGLTLLATNLVGIPVDGASLNPARSLAPALLSVGWSSAQWAIKEVWLFWLAPILGGLLASIVEAVFRPAGSKS